MVKSYEKQLLSIEDELEQLIQMHKDIKTILPRKSRSRKWAIWMLQGGSLSLTNHALNQVKNRDDFIYLTTHLRLATEMAVLAEYFSRKTTPLKEVNAWFNSNITGFESPQYTQFKKGDSWKASHKSLNGYLSSYAHPSYDLIRNMFKWSAKKGDIDFYSITNNFHDQKSALDILKLYIRFSRDIFWLSDYDEK